VLRCALTIDDAPAPEGYASGELMDAMRRTLERHGVKHCVAFVIGERAAGHEAELERWLAAGYELGNHTHEHAAASSLPAREVVRSFERCDAVLQRLGAFAGGRARYARFPFGDRGNDPPERVAIRRGVLDLGYTLADVSLSLSDYLYDAPLQAALREGRTADAAEIERRFAAQAHAELRRGQHTVQLRAAHGVALAVPSDFIHVTAMHFTPGGARFFERLLSAWAGQASWLPLADAAQHDIYTRFGENPAHNGVIAGALRSEASLAANVAVQLTRRGARFARKLGVLREDPRGPRWPHWTC
jgi:peptidoglycan/xylan/chitin deacetylase (PgdA/CDA1 family)